MTTENDLMLDQLSASYRQRYPLLQALSTSLEQHVKNVLSGIPHVDRVSFRAKTPKSFADKAIDRDNSGALRYTDPHEEVEDQVAGRVLVFFRRDISIVTSALLDSLSRVEQVRKAPQAHDAFAYESEHLVLIVPPHVLPEGWEGLQAKPSTFEMQIRTLFMHAWAEPQHDLAYKSAVELTTDEKRKLAWAASSAWGGDEIFEQVLDSVDFRSSC